jgi:hypothetical protein
VQFCLKINLFCLHRKAEIFLLHDCFLQTTFFKCKNKIIDSVLSENPLLHTDKADKKNHGKGISIVKSIAQKYGGDVVISEKNNEFIVSVILDNRIFT